VLAVDVDGYRVESECPSEGGVRLFKARQIVADTPVFLQLWEGPASAARSSIRALAGLRHPGLATVLDVGETSHGQVYASLVALPGDSLAEQLSKGLDLDQSLALLRRMALVLQFLEARVQLNPCLAPASVYSDALGRPVLTRLTADPASTGASAPSVSLLHLFHEALTGHAPAETVPHLPDYLRRWQPLLDLLGDPATLSPQRLLRVVDSLQGRMPADASAASPPTTAPVDPSPARAPRPGGPGQDRGAAIGEAAETHAASVPPRRADPALTPAPSAALARQELESAKSVGRGGDHALASSLSAAPAPSGSASPRPPAAGTLAPHERVTAPARRLRLGAGRHRADRRAMDNAALPTPPSRVPLLLAAVLALPLSATAAWWMLSGRGDSAPALSQSAPTERSSATAAATPSNAAAVLAGDPGWPPAEPAADPVEEWSPQLTVEIDLRLLPTVEDPLERLLGQARTNLQAGRWIAPPGRNALDRYLQALRIEPGNSAARDGIGELAGLCLEGARAALEVDAQLQALACVERVAAANDAGAPAAKAAQDFRRAEHDRHVQAGNEALATWRSSDARSHFADGLRLWPSSAEAAAGLDESERQGKTGYRFHDGLTGGSRGPEMIVLDGLAWTRTEITREEFRAYWAAAGRARFGGDMPACRDRESLLRSSRRRDWNAPGFSQTDAHPVTCVSFAMAQHYVEWLSEASGHAYRLPRLVEWRAAAGSAPSGCRANFRDATAVQAWGARDAAACSDGHAYTALAANAGDLRGLLGLWGNVAEWLEDCDANNCRQRLAAGGSWFSGVGAPAYRGFAVEPGFTTIGVRVVRAIPASD
jgi:serine/threonine-protein kinase PpkA